MKTFIAALILIAAGSPAWCAQAELGRVSATLALAILAASVAGYFSFYHALSEVGGKAFEGPQIEEPFQR